MSLGMKINEAQKREYRKKGYWGDATLADYWNMSVLKAPEKEAVVDLQGARYTYAQLDEAAKRVSAFLIEVGVKPNDIVSVQLPGWAEFVLIYVACLKVGAVINPILPNLRESDLSYILNKCESKVLFIPSRFKKQDYPNMVKAVLPHVPSLQKIVIVEKENRVDEGTTLAGIIKQYSPLSGDIKRSADDLAAVLFTSGTEGNPKGVMLTHNNIIASEKAFSASLNLTYLDVILMPAPVAHASGFHHGVTASIMNGAKVVLQDIFNPNHCLELIDHERCTCGFGCTPVIYDLLRVIPKSDNDISSMRFFLCGGAPVPRHMVEQGLEAGFKILSVYGSTESVPHTGVRLEDPIEKIIHTDGTSFPGIEIRVVDEFRKPVLERGVKGEEASRGPNVFVGYLKEPELTDRVLDDEGWYYSGDLCTMDKDGYIRINGRKKDIIIRGGENISSNEIERILHQHPNVYDVAVIGLPDPRLGERACAFVVLNNNQISLSIEEIKTFFAEMKVSKYKYPERVEIVDSLPRTETGKVKKYLLREMINSQQEPTETMVGSCLYS